MTWITSVTASSSSNSEDATTTPKPTSCTSWRISARISAFAATSIPCVGSSSSRTLGFDTSARASASFCWLPPLRFPARISVLAGRMPSASTYSRASCRSLRIRRIPARLAVEWMGSARFARTDSPGTMAEARRSAGTSTAPAR